MFAALGRIGCHDPQPATTNRPAAVATYFACTACLSDDATRCAAFTPECHDSHEQKPSEIGARQALCDTLSPAELARRPAPADFKPTPWAKNACYAWPDDAIKTTCATVAKGCDGTPIH
jgi:hypothetical protein